MPKLKNMGFGKLPKKLRKLTTKDLQKISKIMRKRQPMPGPVPLCTCCCSSG